MDTMVTLNLIGYALAVAAGVVLGTMFGRMVLKDLVSLAHGFEVRLSSLEQRLIHRGASALDSASHAAALEHHAAATEKLAAALNARAESANSPHPAAH
jgi:hypothetical protein